MDDFKQSSRHRARERAERKPHGENFWLSREEKNCRKGRIYCSRPLVRDSSIIWLKIVVKPDSEANLSSMEKSKHSNKFNPKVFERTNKIHSYIKNRDYNRHDSLCIKRIIPPSQAKQSLFLHFLRPRTSFQSKRASEPA